MSKRGGINTANPQEKAALEAETFCNAFACDINPKPHQIPNSIPENNTVIVIFVLLLRILGIKNNDANTNLQKVTIEGATLSCNNFVET